MQEFIALKTGKLLREGHKYWGTSENGYVLLEGLGTFYIDLFKPAKKYPYLGVIRHSGKVVMFLGSDRCSPGIVVRMGTNGGDNLGFFYKYWSEGSFERLTSEEALMNYMDIYPLAKYLEGKD